MLSARRVFLKCNLAGGIRHREELVARGQPAPNHSSLPSCEHGKGAGHCSFPRGPRGCREEGNTKGSREDTNHPNNFAKHSTEEEVTRFSIDTSKLYLQLTPVTHVITMPSGGRAKKTCQPLPLVIITRVHTPTAKRRRAGEGVRDGSQPRWSCPGGATPPSQPWPSRAALSQPSADLTSPKPFPTLWAGLWLCCNLITLPGCFLFLGKQMTATGREQESQ